MRVGDPNDIAEFFVLRKHRRTGVGRRAAAEVLRRFPGRWTVRQQLTKPDATAFWRAAIEYPVIEGRTADEVVMEFTVSK